MVTTYRLKVSDFRFIEPPPNFQSAPSGQKGKPTAAKALTYDELLSRPMLTYRNPWEFVAERFHCDETFLRALNPTIRGTPAPGTEFRVPNVKPFLIEDSLPPQPPQGSTPDISAAVVDLSRLEIYQSDKLVACFPVASARPGLRGRGTWVILDAIPRPRLTTFREPREQPKPVASFYAGPTPTPQPPPLLAEKEILHAGPRNPVGILWINLAKSDDPTPLPFGLHGSGAPSRMTTHSGLGGFRMTNWDIARAIPYLAPGTVLSWRQSPPPQIAPARPAEAVVPAPAIPEAVPPQPHPTP
jgi:lipoprotein-anchoring transpeptidase ErfK/SrfK